MKREATLSSHQRKASVSTIPPRFGRGMGVPPISPTAPLLLTLLWLTGGTRVPPISPHTHAAFAPLTASSPRFLAYGRDAHATGLNYGAQPATGQWRDMLLRRWVEISDKIVAAPQTFRPASSALSASLWLIHCITSRHQACNPLRMNRQLCGRQSEFH